MAVNRDMIKDMVANLTIAINKAHIEGVVKVGELAKVRATETEGDRVTIITGGIETAIAALEKIQGQMIMVGKENPAAAAERARPLPGEE